MRRYRAYLSIMDGGLWARLTDNGPSERLVPIYSYEDYVRVCNEEVCAYISVSSSVDFPEENGADADVVALCNRIRTDDEEPECSCHFGSVCSDACTRGRHHAGCPFE